MLGGWGQRLLSERGGLVTHAAPVVFKDGRYDDRTLREWLPDVVDLIVKHLDPLRIILFGSLATGTENRDSDIDLLVVLAHVAHKKAATTALRRATETVPVPVDLIPTDPDEIRRRGHLVGSVLRPALRDGTVVYERAA